jgi:hypothetical protein
MPAAVATSAGTVTDPDTGTAAGPAQSIDSLARTDPPPAAGPDPAAIAAALTGAVGQRIGTIHLTVPLTTLLGLSAEPGEAAGYGPLTAEVTRQMAAAASSPQTRWCLTVSDADGEPLHHGHPTYRPPAAMAHLVRATRPTCCFPGCSRPSHRCDLDHRIPHHQGGATCPCNLQPLCRRHHRTKQANGWQVSQHPGRLAWTTPAGRTYHTETTRPPPPATHPSPHRSPMELAWHHYLLDLPHHQRPPVPQRR